ncbi:MAG: LamG domain-containing protein [Chitinophagaceae bacterium]|nr:LamG domain-containing protein [Chitinophagaceae bacterium]
MDGSNANYALYITNTNKAQFTFQRNPISGTAPNATGTTTITDGNWHYLVGTYDGTDLKIYVDGVLEATTADVSVPMTGANPLYIGTSAGSSKLNGSLDEVSIWNTALTATQINNLIGQQLAGNETNLVAYYNFDGITKSGQGLSVINLCTSTGATLNGTTVGTVGTPIFTCSEIPVTDPPCSILLNGYADAVTAVNGSSPVTYPTIGQNFTMEIVAKPLLEKRGSGTGGYPIWPAGHYLQNGQVGQTYVIPPDAGSSFGVGHAGVGISLGTNGIGVYEGANGYLQAPAVYNAPIADWSHITVVSENNKLKLYVNGALKYSAPASGFILHPSIGLGGYTSALSGSYAGYVSEVRVWNTVLTSDEIRNNINVNLTGAEANLARLYKFGSNTANGKDQIITGAGSMASSIVYKTEGSNYTPLFTCANTTAVPKDTLPGSGKMLTFNGNGLYSALNGSAFAELGNWGNAPAQGSIACWFNANSIKNNAVLFSTTHFRNQTGKHKGFDVFIKNNKLLLTIGTDTTVTGYQDTVTVLNNVITSKWNHLTLTWDAGANTYNVYINGLSVASGTSSFLPTKFESVKAGSGIVSGYAYAWDGLIDELSEWNKILSATEIKQQMCSKINTAQANYANVLHYYRFDNTTSSNNFISDYAGTAHGIYCMPFLYDYWVYGNGGPFFHDQIPSHYFIDLLTSSAPIGAYSSYQYAGNTSSTSLQIGNAGSNTNADVVSATITSGAADGIHMYGEDMWPNTVTGIDDTLAGSKRYAGVYMVNPNTAAYTLQYDYTNNPFVTPVNEPYLRLKER